MSNKSLDEARFNLATHIMSNGVELIIASDRVKHSDKQSQLYQVSNSIPSSRHIQEAKKPVTFAPSTLINHMILAVPTAKQDKLVIPVSENQFITKTCLTTYTYYTTYLLNGSPTVESMEKVVSNRHTEERNYLRASNYLPLGVTLSNTPELVVGIFPTTYHYINKFRDNDHIITSSYTIINTVTGPEDYISFLQPSEETIPLKDTNTYYSRLPSTISIPDRFESTAILTDENILTQVVITESIPPRGTSKVQSSPGLTSNNIIKKLDLDVHIYATKTLLTTITYLETSTSEYNKDMLSKVTFDTFTKYHTQVVESVITDVVPSSLLTSELVSIFRHELMQKNSKNNRKVMITQATLLSGQTLQVTAVSIPKGSLIAITSSLNQNVNGIYEKLSNGNTINESMILGITHKSKPSITIKPSAVQKNVIGNTKSRIKILLQKNSETESEDGLNLADSEIKDIYINPLKDTSSHPPSSTVEQLIGSFNLQRFRPVFNVMADLLKKNIVGKQTQQKIYSSRITTEAQNQTTTSHSQSTTDDGPNYIPLQVVNQYKLIKEQYGNSSTFLSRYSPDNYSPKNELDISLSRLSAHSLHINPPEFDFSDIVVDDNWLKQQNINIYRNYIQSLRPPTSGYHHSLLNKGIPIRPGEIINANADVIIGKPNGIGAQISRPSEHYLLEYGNKSVQSIANLQPSKKETWISSMIPLSLIPPHIIPLPEATTYEEDRFNRVPNDDYNTITILRPPSQISKTYPKYISYSASAYVHPSDLGHTTSINHLRSQILTNTLSYNGHIYGSEQQISNLNSDLNNNEILEIKQIHQIFSTKLPSVTRYPLLESTKYMQIPSKLSIKPAFSAHHNINLKLDVLSHNVKMNLPPLTFKKDNENFPLATAIQGTMAVPPMPLIKVPINRAHVEVRLTPQGTQLAIEPPEQYATSTFKQRNENLSKTSDSKPIQGLTSASPNENLYNTIKKPNRNLLYINSTSMSLKPKILRPNFTTNIKNNIKEDLMKWMDSNPLATNKQSVYLKINHRNSTNQLSPALDLQEKESHPQEDQTAEYSTYKLKNNFPNRNTFHVRNSVQSYKSIGLGQPFINPALTELRMGFAPVVSNIPKKLYFATGERFNIRSKLMSEFIRPFAASTEIYVNSGPTDLSHPPISTFLITISKNTLINETEMKGSFRLQPPLLSSADNHFISIATMAESNNISPPPYLSTVIPNFSHKTTTSGTTALRNSLYFENVHSSILNRKDNSLRTQKIRKTSTILKSASHQNSAVNIKAMLLPTLKTIIPSSNIKLSTKAKINKTLRPPITSSIELSLFPSNTWKNNSFNINGYSTVNHALLYIDRSSHSSLESSEVLLPTEMNFNFAIDSINSQSVVTVVNKKNRSDFLDDVKTTRIQDGISETSELTSLLNKASINKEIIIQSSELGTSPISVIGSQIVTKISKGRNKDFMHTITPSNSKLHILRPTPEKTDNASKKTLSNISVQQISKNALVVTTLITSDKIKPEVSSFVIAMSTASDNKKSGVLERDYDSNISFELPIRDEEIEPHLNSELLGGVLKIPSSKESSRQSTDVCNPSCKTAKNEICTNILGYGSRCECRLGFARIFPDRPCKPTYTYEMSVPASRVGSYLLKFNHEFLNNSSSQYRHLSSIILDAIDRMVMQSDFRDEYYGVQLKDFSTASDGAVIGNFVLQLSENSDENRLETVFKKYLRQSNYSIGGTELYASKENINSLRIQDFNECGNDTFNDCSIHAQCFNLVGSYTCICPDGYSDISDNPIYPGRHCSDKVIGCDKCNYHGNCASQTLNGTAVCECFAWYTGATCQLNLKILLICLIVIVTVFVVLLVCILFIYTKHNTPGGSLTRPIFITASNFHHPSMLTTSHKISPGEFFRERSIENNAILNDSISESSQTSEPYIFKKTFDVGLKAKSLKRNNIGPNEPFNRSSLNILNATEVDQTDRSLSVMIPRARYFHPTVLPQAQLMHHQLPMENCDKPSLKRRQSQLNLSFNDAKDISTIEDSSELPQKNGALVSAGFEVSAIVNDRGAESNDVTLQLKGNEKESISLSSKGQNKQQQISRTNLEAIIRSGEEIQRMSSWMSNIHTNTISADVRSFDETTVQAVTKSMHLCFDVQTQSTTNEEPNTMTERDLGTTFLLPHTHLYLPEKIESDFSGFDSI